MSALTLALKVHELEKKIKELESKIELYGKESITFMRNLFDEHLKQPKKRGRKPKCQNDSRIEN